jgi:hypothetical protein
MRPRAGARASAVAWLSILVVTCAPAATAHEAHRDSASSADSVRADSLPADSVGAATVAGGRPVPQPYVLSSPARALLAHPHNKLIHFPIVLSLLAALLLWLPRRPPELLAAVRLIVIAATITAVAAYFTGQSQAEGFAGEPKEWVVELHRIWGIAVALALGVWAALLTWRPAGRIPAWWGLVVTALVTVASFLGGVVAHGD